MYFTGDGARRDADDYYWITGRVDDVINVAGHRLGTAEIESAMVAHPQVAEAAVVGFSHDIKGQGIYVYVTLIAGVEPNEPLRAELRNWVREEISPICNAGCDPMGARASENTLCKDHAPNSSQNRRERARSVGRHINASGSKRRPAAN
jgi:acyl-CoA synthetase (AMP-forming)/AMP-acid ligase II